MYYANKQTHKLISNKQKLNKMKNIAKVFVAAAVVLGCSSTSSFAQASATASATANIITPITIALVTNMNLGNIAVSPTSGGTVVLGTGNSRTSTGGVTLPSTTGTVASASFTVSGTASFTYAITLPSSATLSDGASHTMTMGTFTSSPSSTGTLSSGGTQTLTVGATLTVAAAQAPNSYSNATAVPVTVNYN